MENYYDILEVSPKASKEIIDKAYKTLAKKYHPDANPEDKKKWAEEKFKKINEAYEIISDKQKREEYDIKMQQEKERLTNESENLKIRYQKLYEQNQELKNRLNSLNVVPTTNTHNNGDNIQENLYNNIQEEANRKITQSVNKAYHDAYIQRMRDYGYRVYHKKTLKEKARDWLSIVVTISVILIIALILWQIPAIRNYVESNKIFQAFKNAFYR